MQKQIKKFIGSLDMDKNTQEIVLNNFMGMTIFNIDIKGKSISFDSLTNFDTVEHVEVEAETTYLIWEMFHNFRTTKNAVNTLMAVADGSHKKISETTFKDQSRITPKKEINAETFNEFMESVTDDQQKTLIEAIKAWFEDCLYTELPNFFRYNKINTEDSKVERGTYVLYTVAPQSYYGKVFQAHKDSWISLVDERGYFTLPEESTLKVIDAKDIPAEILEEIEAQYDKYSDAGEIARGKALENLMTKREKQEEQLEKNYNRLERRNLSTLERVEKVEELFEKLELTPEHEEEIGKKLQAARTSLEAEQKKADKEKAEAYEVLKSLKLTSEADIKGAVKQLNNAKLPEDKQTEIKKRIKAAKSKIEKAKTIAQDKKAGSSKKAGAEAKAKAKSKRAKSKAKA